MVARRKLLAAAAGGGALLVSPARWASAAPLSAAPPLDPADIVKYVDGLPIPPTMPMVRTGMGRILDEYVVAVRQFRQQILPSDHPATVVWGYGSPAHHGSFGTPAPTIEARVDRPVRITWVNQLVDRRGRYLPHLLPVDPTLHWANPGGGPDGRDHRPHFTRTPGRYTGPVPFVTHLHGAHATHECDGNPESWYLPVARDIPAHFANFGSRYHELRAEFDRRHRRRWAPGSATYQYDNDQRATALWYHDHTLGVTRLNVYAGPVGFYLLRGGPADLPAGVLPGRGADRCGEPDGRCHEIPLVVQDRSFNVDGSLRYPAARSPVNGFTGPFYPDSDVPPVWNPVVLSDTMTVNGRTWPVLPVEPRRYRFRVLNGCNARFLSLKVVSHPTARPAAAALPIWQLGSDGGFLPEPVPLKQLPVSNGERADVIVDFTGIPAGTALYLINEGPDAHEGGPDSPPPPADPATTGQVMKFRVVPLDSADHSVPPDQLRLPPCPPLGPASNTRRLAISAVNSTIDGAGPVAQALGVLDADGQEIRYGYHGPVTEDPYLGATEVWELHNLSTEVHPIHLHQVQFQVVGRGPDGERPPGPSERGYKDVVAAFPGEVIRIKARFDLPGRYVWHCHVLEHEDNDMMRPYVVRK
jgi:spore coat protein A